MPNNFWYKLKQSNKIILALAPMAGFSDSAFRQLSQNYGADVVYSEMASAAALYYSDLKKKISVKNKNSVSSLIKNNATLSLLKFNQDKERNYIVQLFGSNPEHFVVATQIVSSLIKPAGIDINFGCPVPKVMKQGAGSALMKDLYLSRAVIKAVLDNTDLPVSIKIRTRVGKIGAVEFIKQMKGLNISSLMVHARSLKEGFSAKPDWPLVKEIKPHFPGIILVNGGINSLEDAKQAIFASGADGLALARGALKRPWLFKEIKNNKKIDLKRQDIFKLILEQTTLKQKLKGPAGIIEFRKHLAWYVQGLAGASKLREKLVKVNSFNDIKNILQN